MNEDHLLDRVAVEQALAGLSESDRMMMKMIFGVEYPADWGGRPVTFTTIGQYIGLRFEGQELSEAAIRYRRDEILKLLRGERGDMRRSRWGKKKKKKK